MPDDKTPSPADGAPGTTDKAATPAARTGGSDTSVFPDLDAPTSPATGAAGEEPTVIESLTAGHAAGQSAAGRNINAMLNVGLNVQIVLGHARMPISQLLELSRGSVIELDKKIGAPVDLVINDRLIARGDLVKVGEDRLGVTLTEIVKDYVSEI
ncbi:flagellar motor switch protein FliN [Mesobaculum littorinae]|uniref:Flagellar motor switch protein FliN n=1 Tax=Mesobaculum littorinae TaxID=2486419 RepID=A0A438ADU5_9RHOB|nr:FliM/FliN family flagellar motor switch protein [Mesobaculum littorinae]RVV96876.1 flagellar motor switch protein FliN [Mesobaculum littorinae]